jgi:vitamin K-dependent gamma-carboxylase
MMATDVDGSSLAVVRRLFGVLALIATIRFVATGCISEYYEMPSHFFAYDGFAWIKPWPHPGMYIHFGAMAVLAIAIIANRHTRIATAGFGVLFAYAHLIDKTNYLNHYYLVICLCFVLALLPTGARIPRWALWAVRAQVGLVYVFGGIAKLKYAWLFEAQPMSIWLSANGLDHGWMAFAASWAGMLFDLSIVPLLLWHRSRPFAYLAVVVFHVTTAMLFQLGLFPWIMIGCSLIFLPPDWPNRWLGRPARPSPPAARPHRAIGIALAIHFALQLLLPFRHFLYRGDVCWTEQGFRFAWHVMVMEKDGSVVLHVTDPATHRRWDVRPGDYLTRYQTKMMAPQPDMILQLAHIVADDFRARGVAEPIVTVDAFVSLNGRPRARLIDPTVDLARETSTLGNTTWILTP